MGFLKKLFGKKKKPVETEKSKSKAQRNGTSPRKPRVDTKTSTSTSTNAITKTSPNAAGIPMSRSTSYPKSNSRKQSPARQTASEHVRSQGSPQFAGSPPSVLTSQGTYQTATANYAEEPLQLSNSMGSGLSPRLSQQQLQQFDRQNANALTAGPPMYTMSADLPPAQRMAMEDMRSDASSSSFNLSTDAEDSEYESLRRRGVLPTAHMDASLISGGMTAFSADSSEMLLRSNAAKTAAMLRPIPTQHTPDDEPGRILSPAKSQTNQIVPMTNETEDDLRAWTMHPDTISPHKQPPTAQTGTLPQQQKFTFEDTAHSTQAFSRTANSGPVDPPPSTKSRTTAPRNFTSPTSYGSSNTSGFSPDPDFDFADFNAFGHNAFTGNNNSHSNANEPAWKEEKKTPDTPPEPKPMEAMPVQRDYAPSATSSATNPDSSLSELLAQAKNKQRRTTSKGSNWNNTSRASNVSVNSAPAITSSYLRKQHNLGRYSAGNATAGTTNYSNPTYTDTSASDNRPSSNDATSISDIIDSLEATNQSRKAGRNSYGHRSVGDTGAVSTVRAVKERLREKRRKEREFGNRGLKSKSSDVSSSDHSDNDASESWLFEEVTGALGPRGIAADLESLSGRSKSSQGNKSHRSHRSRSRRSRHTRRHKSSGESVDSRGSRYSHRSTRSYLSQMSEQSRSVANDLLRLEMQLAMVGSSSDARDDIPARIGGSASVGGTSRASRSGRKSSSSSTSHRPGVLSTAGSHLTRRSKATVLAPPGKLGIILANKADSKGTVVSGVRTSSVLVDKISPGDRIIAIDGEDVSRMTVSEITTIMSRKAEYERTLTVLTTTTTTTTTHKDPPAYGTNARSPSKTTMSTTTTSTDGFETTFPAYSR